MSDNKTKKNSNKKDVDKRSKTLGLFSAGSVILLVAFVLVLNIIFDNFIGDFTTFDLSATGQNSISQVTKDYIDGLPQDSGIRIIGLFERPANIKDTPYEYIVPLLDDYQAKSDGRITVEYIDPQVYPSIISELDPQGMYDLVAQTYVVSFNGKLQSIDPYSCFTYDSEYLSYGTYIPTANAAETTFTNAIVNLTQGYKYKAYFLSGLQEYSHEQLSRILDALGIEAEDLPASDNFNIPDDCSMIIVNGINTDITENMALKLKDYITHSGKMLVAVDFSTNNVAVTYDNLNSVLHELNLHIDPYVIQENDASYQQNGVYYSLIDVASDFAVLSPSTSKLRNSYARPVRSYDLPYNYISVSPLLTTSDSATTVMVDPSTGVTTQFNNEGKYNVGMYATYSDSQNPPALFVIGTMAFTADDYISTYSYNDANVIFLRNLIRTMLNDTDSVIVDVKPLSDYSVDVNKVTSSTVSVYSFILMVIVPLAFVIAGTVIYKKRKNL